MSDHVAYKLEGVLKIGTVARRLPAGSNGIPKGWGNVLKLQDGAIVTVADSVPLHVDQFYELNDLEDLQELDSCLYSELAEDACKEARKLERGSSFDTDGDAQMKADGLRNQARTHKEWEELIDRMDAL